MAHVKVRKKGKKSWAFLSTNGANRLRVHALIFADTERAQQVIDENAANNPDWEWKIVP